MRVILFIDTQHLEKHGGHGSSQAVSEDERPVVSHFDNNLIINVSPPSLPNGPFQLFRPLAPQKVAPFWVGVNIGSFVCGSLRDSQEEKSTRRVIRQSHHLNGCIVFHV